MEITIQSPYGKVSHKAKNSVLRKFSRFEKMFDRILQCMIVLKKEKSAEQNNFMVEAKLSVPGQDLFAKEHAESFEAAAEKVCAGLENQIRKHKGKLETKSPKVVDAYISTNNEEPE